MLIGRYRVVELIGRGSFGCVFKVIDSQGSEPRALKIGAGRDGWLLDEFEQLARLEHPSLPRVFEVGRTSEPIEEIAAGAPFFISEWISGGRSDARVWQDPSSVWSLMADVAGALAVIHAAGLVHGDVAPANVLVVEQPAGLRGVLVDLGLASGGGARGTPQYMAPEAFAGHVEPRSDLYALGATMFRLVTGRPPFEAAGLGELVQQIVAGASPPAVTGVPQPMADLIRRLLARDADARPASALAVLEELDQLAPVIATGLARRARPKVGAPPAPAAWPGAKPIIDTLARGLGSGVHVVAGVAASGARQLVDGALRQFQLAEVAHRRQATSVIAGSLDEVAATVSARATPQDARGFIQRVARAAREAAAIVVFELGDDPRAGELVAALARTGGDRAAIVIVDQATAARADVATHAVPLLDLDGVRELAARMIGGEPPRTWIHALHEASGGLALTAVELLRSIAGEANPYAIDWAARTTRGAAELRSRQLAAVSVGARRLAVALAVWGGRARLDRALATARSDAADKLGLAEVVELERAGLVRRRGDELAIDRATAEAAEGLDPRAAALLAAGALNAVIAGKHGAPPDALAALLDRAPLDGERAQFACEVADQLLARGRPDRARALAIRAIAAAPARAGLVAARAAAVAGAYREVETLARNAHAAGADPTETQLVVARAAQRAGDLDAAERALAKLHAQDPEHAEIAGTFARLLVTRSRFADARRVAIAGGGPLTGLRAEAAGLAAFYLGELDEADRAFAALEVGGTASGDAAAVGRALSLRGMVAQQRGQLGLASDRYREAARRLAEVGEVHAAATAELNLGTALAERGRASEALPRLAAAGRVFADLGATTEQVAADLNRGNALLAVGQADEARVAAEAAVARADGAPHLRAFALLVLGDARRKLGDESLAERCYRDALAIALERGDAHAQVSSYIALAEAGHAVEADVEQLATSDDDRDRWVIARGRLALRRSEVEAGTWSGRLRDSASHRALRDSGTQSALRESGSHPALADANSHRAFRDSGSHQALRDPARPAVRDFTPERRPSDAELIALARACAEVAVRAADSDRLERAFRGHAVAAQLAQRGRDAALARSEADRARSAHGALVTAAAPAFRAALEADSDLVRLPAGDQAPMGSVRHEDSAAHLRRLLTLSRRLNTEANVDRILDEVIDTAIELTAAERGFLLLRQPDGELAAVVSRNFAMGDLEAPANASGASSVSALGGVSTLGGVSALGMSRSIAERAAQTGEPVLTVDAGIDERFAVAASVAALRLRSVLAVPLRQRGVVTGCIYVDHRLRGGAFDDAAATVLGELADIAAIAIENARLTDDLRRSTREVDSLNSRLSSELADRDAELVRVKADLPDRDRLRHRYDRIVGRSPATMRMLEIVDRAAATSLPVVIVGESGTGKELVARALHDNGPRRDGAFVAINCSAVPEPLLESELFGHVRGAFTGADRDRRGLFEVADGGTLFLDEIADTSPAMQAKLLRVLQDGMIRRVGDNKTRKVDVRVVAASQRSLAELAAAGTFREDLRFRLEVIAVPVPPLRDRDGDIPLLVERLLAQLCAGRSSPRLTRAAVRALSQHRWPGNIRELENALARGVAMGGDVIDLGDLPEALVAVAGRPEPAKPPVGDDLRLKPALLATEQAYISAAMSRAKSNQTAAARLLGLSRFGLQKKLRRLAGEDAADEDD
ncbi:MAG: Response regulator of zinc sigma-54-dependent two-component system [Myxococcales bacterium]|nr:Response regulator of zinc sigma-54-dependent two-component system [Myxococcales bacterium]